MANIKPYTDAIRTAVYGEEVRGAIADAIDAMNTESSGAYSAATSSQDSASASAAAAAVSETNATAAAMAAADVNTVAKSWAVGPSGTGISGTDTNNAKYWSEQAASSAGSIPALQTQVNTLANTTVPAIQSQVTTINGTTIPNIVSQMGFYPSWSTKTLMASYWNENNEYSLESDFPSTTYDIWAVVPHISQTTDEQREVWAAADCGGYDPSANKITAKGTKPTINIVVAICYTQKALNPPAQS